MVATPPMHPEPVSAVAEFRPSARAVLQSACDRGGRQSVLLSWPGGATYLPSRCFQPGPFDAIVGQVAGCPVYADRRQLSLFLDRKVVIGATRAQPDAPLSVQVTQLVGERALEEKFVAIIESLTAELTSRLAGSMDPAVIRAQVEAALDDLRGSVPFDSLAEMAIRLAAHRLGRGPEAQAASSTGPDRPDADACCEVTHRAVRRGHRTRA